MGYSVKNKLEDPRLKKTVKFQSLTSSQNADISAQAEDGDVIDVIGSSDNVYWYSVRGHTLKD